MIQRRSLTYYLTENISYKVLASLITLILWVSVMGRGDYVINRTIKVNLIVPIGYELGHQSTKEVQVKLEGPRNRLLQYSSLREDRPINLQIEHSVVGQFEMPITFDQLEIPNGIKLLSIKPNSLRVELKKK
jgi:YbbR domain-containing protein